MQATLESSLSYTMKNEDAQSAWAIVMEVETGKILGGEAIRPLTKTSMISNLISIFPAIRHMNLARS